MAPLRFFRPFWPQNALSWQLLPPPEPERLQFPRVPEQTPLVRPGQSVRRGQRLFFGPVNRYSPVSGTVVAGPGDALTVQNDFLGLSVPFSAVPTLDALTPGQILTAIGESGSQGPDGRPTADRLRDLSQAPRVLLISCLDTAGQDQSAVLFHKGEQVLGGIRILLRLLRIPRAVLAVPAETQPLWDKLRRLLPADGTVTARPVPLRYPPLPPQRFLAREDRAPDRSLLLWAQEAAAVYDCVYLGRPVLTRILTVCWEGQSRTLEIPLGTPAGTALLSAGAPLSGSAVLLGDGLTGRPLTDPAAPLGLDTPLLTLLPHRLPEPERSCLHCGRCAARCPARLRPDRLFRDPGQLSGALAGQQAKCLGCGLCQYVCPTGLRLPALPQPRFPQEVSAYE